MTNLNILTDIWNWIKEDSIVKVAVDYVWKYECRTVSDGLFGVSNKKAIVLEILPAYRENKFSSQQNGMLEVFGYCSDTIVNGKKTSDDGKDKCWNLFYIFDKLLCRKDRENVSLTNFIILGMDRNGEPIIQYDEEQNCPFILVTYDFSYLLK